MVSAKPLRKKRNRFSTSKNIILQMNIILYTAHVRVPNDIYVHDATGQLRFDANPRACGHVLEAIFHLHTLVPERGEVHGTGQERR